MTDDDDQFIPPGGIPIQYIKGYESIITNRESVLAYFRANRDMAYSVEDLHFIRKVLRRLLDEDNLERTGQYGENPQSQQQVTVVL